MNSYSGIYNAVPLRLIGGSTPVPRQEERPVQRVSTTGWASPPPPSFSNRMLAVFYLSTLFGFGIFVIVGNTLLRSS